MAFDDPKKVYFFFDYISHNAYLAWCKVPELAARSDS
jgi:2-hydroxychromene-2-carboxylate isomerase